jgi:hypothetical protein
MLTYHLFKSTAALAASLYSASCQLSGQLPSHSPTASVGALASSTITLQP